MLTRRTLSLCLLFSVAAGGFATAAPNKPRSVIHVITIQWKADATPEQIQQAIRAAENINLRMFGRSLSKCSFRRATNTSS